MVQFVNTLKQILNADSVRPLEGMRRHLGWQWRKMFDAFPVELTLGQSKLYIHQPCGVAALVNAMGEYDYNNMHFLRMVLARTGATFVDVGANIGSYTVLASEVRDATVVGIEPHPLTFKWLRENVRINDRTNVTCLNVALSDHDGPVYLTDGKEPSINKLVPKNRPNASMISVEACRLETICNCLKITPDIVKIDVEGHEPEVLSGLGTYSSQPKIIFVENGERKSISEWMQQAGFIGPYFAHTKLRQLVRSQQRRPEDPLYFNRDFSRQFAELGFSISA